MPSLPHTCPPPFAGSYLNVLPSTGWSAGANTISFSLPLNWTVVK
jgi:hypothetical protein